MSRSTDFYERTWTQETFEALRDESINNQRTNPESVRGLAVFEGLLETTKPVPNTIEPSIEKGHTRYDEMNLISKLVREVDKEIILIQFREKLRVVRKHDFYSVDEARMMFLRFVSDPRSVEHLTTLNFMHEKPVLSGFENLDNPISEAILLLRTYRKVFDINTYKKRISQYKP